MLLKGGWINLSSLPSFKQYSWKPQQSEKRKGAEFVKRSQKARANKMSGVPEGEKVDPGHRQGARSTLSLIDDMTQENNDVLPDPVDVCVKTKDGTQLLPKAAEVKERYEGMLGEASQSGEKISPNEAYYRAIGGRKRGGVPGLGSASDVYYKKLRSRTPSNVAYAPSVVAQLNSKVEEVTRRYEQRIAEQDERYRAMEEAVRMLSEVVKERCGDLVPPDLFRNDGLDPDGATGSAPAAV